MIQPDEWGEWEWRKEPDPFETAMHEFHKYLATKWFEREFAVELRELRERQPLDTGACDALTAIK